jgi:hypothetical protein
VDKQEIGQMLGGEFGQFTPKIHVIVKMLLIKPIKKIIIFILHGSILGILLRGPTKPPINNVHYILVVRGHLPPKD